MSTDEDEDRRGDIVVGVDGSRSSRKALAWAAKQAALTGARLVAITCWDYPVNYGWAPPWPPEFDPAADSKAMLDRVVDEVLGAGASARVTTATFEGHPAPVLVELSKTASLVVVGSRGHGEFAGMLLGSVSEFLTTHAHCPVLVVRCR